jgi:hypothetical protein
MRRLGFDKPDFLEIVLSARKRVSKKSDIPKQHEKRCESN